MSELTFGSCSPGARESSQVRVSGSGTHRVKWGASLDINSMVSSYPPRRRVRWQCDGRRYVESVFEDVEIIDLTS